MALREPASVTITVRAAGQPARTLLVGTCVDVALSIDYGHDESSWLTFSPEYMRRWVESIDVRIERPMSRADGEHAYEVRVGYDPEAENARLRQALETIRGVETDPNAEQFLPGLAMAALEMGWPQAKGDGT